MDLNGVEILLVVFNGIDVQLITLYKWRMDVDVAIGAMTRIVVAGIVTSVFTFFRVIRFRTTRFFFT
jgi:uncharacterized integral membrane protein